MAGTTPSKFLNKISKHFSQPASPPTVECEHFVVGTNPSKIPSKLSNHSFHLSNPPHPFPNTHLRPKTTPIQMLESCSICTQSISCLLWTRFLAETIVLNQGIPPAPPPAPNLASFLCDTPIQQLDWSSPAIWLGCTVSPIKIDINNYFCRFGALFRSPRRGWRLCPRNTPAYVWADSTLLKAKYSRQLLESLLRTNMIH